MLELSGRRLTVKKALVVSNHKQRLPIPNGIEAGRWNQYLHKLNGMPRYSMWWMFYAEW